MLGITGVMRWYRGRGADGRVRHVTGTGFHVGLWLIHACVGAASGVVSRERNGILLLSTRMHVLVYAVLALVYRLFRRRGFETGIVVRIAVGGRRRRVLLVHQSRQACVCVVPIWLVEPVVVDVSYGR